MSDETNRNGGQTNRHKYLQSVDRRRFMRTVGAVTAGGALIGASAQPVAAGVQGSEEWAYQYYDPYGACLSKLLRVYDAYTSFWDDGEKYYRFLLAYGSYAGVDDCPLQLDDCHIKLDWEEDETDVHGKGDWIGSTGVNLTDHGDTVEQTEEALLDLASAARSKISVVKAGDWVVDNLLYDEGDIDRKWFGWELSDAFYEDQGGISNLVVVTMKHGEYADFKNLTKWVFEDEDSGGDYYEAYHTCKVGLAAYGEENIHTQFADDWPDWETL